MPQVHIKHVISFTSEDSSHTIDKFIKGRSSWLSGTNDKSGSLKADLQLDKAVTISHIDIGNSGSMMLSIEVGRSSWPTSRPFVTLLPTVSLITPADWRAGRNTSSVRMFKNSDFDSESSKEKWDQIRIICNHPFCKNQPFGLAFLKLFTCDEVNSENKEKNADDLRLDFSDVEAKKELLLNKLNLSSNKKIAMSDSLKTLEKNQLVTKDDEIQLPIPQVSSPISRAAKLIMAGKSVPTLAGAQMQTKAFECEALEFLISLNLSLEQMETMKVSVIRRQFEEKRTKCLTSEEKTTFKNISLDYAERRFESIEKQRNQRALSRTSFSNTVNKQNILNKPKTPTNNKNISSKNSNSNFSNNNQNSISVVGGFKFKQISQSPTIKNVRKRKSDDIDDFDSPPTFSSFCHESRNSLALTDTNVSPSLKHKRNESKTPKRRSKATTAAETENNLGIWISKSGKENKSNSSLTSITLDSDSDDVLIDNDDPSEAFKNLKGGYRLGSPLGKIGNENNSTSITARMMECPLCSDFFPSHQIETHASMCSSENFPSIPHSSLLKECPMCYGNFSASEIEAHASCCNSTNAVYID